MVNYDDCIDQFTVFSTKLICSECGGLIRLHYHRGIWETPEPVRESVSVCENCGVVSDRWYKPIAENERNICFGLGQPIPDERKAIFKTHERLLNEGRCDLKCDSESLKV